MLKWGDKEGSTQFACSLLLDKLSPQSFLTQRICVMRANMQYYAVRFLLNV